ncbi:GGDEF domain-containing protein [Loktanella agnita]|uniref:GGDEF domain-containing protein n=1 Tax=Loktanella agnita TaxID=287097 RepID=UPI003986C4B0
MLKRLPYVATYLLNPSSVLDALWKLLFLSILTTLLTMAVEYLLLLQNRRSAAEYFVVVTLVASPLFGFGMYLTKRMVHLQRQLSRLARTDLLTGLANRRGFFDLVNAEDPGHLALLDIDHFKKINDSYGHAVGDQVLASVAKEIAARVGEHGLVARIGGEEFALHAPTTNEEIAAALINGLTSNFIVKTEDTPIHVTLSAGWVRTQSCLDMTEILHRADEALYMAKQNGRARAEQWKAVTNPTPKMMRHG